ncbi:uncharacterized protein Dvir_GJ16253 [Drosophila virilis]|uniref:Calponin-homology (CH) domain-containing protein n=1 Tax=Drosophila virilis TaxID=7244 RepID=B4MDI2_DROVI|nr:uncharacterized protein Dvir_GJ16253 [Drosophila virilis]
MSHRRAKNVCLMKRDILSVRAPISWINDALQAEVKELQELCTGAIYCQLMHLGLFPKDVPIAKVHFCCDLQREFETNYRIPRNSFTNLDLNIEIPVRKLQYGRGHYEFVNWFHKFYRVNSNDEPYDALQVRRGSRIGLRQPEKINRRPTQLEETPRKVARIYRMQPDLNKLLPRQAPRRNCTQIEISAS